MFKDSYSSILYTGKNWLCFQWSMIMLHIYLSRYEYYWAVSANFFLPAQLGT